MAYQALCKIEGCDKGAAKRGMCNSHYNAWYRDNVKATDPRRCGVVDCGGPLHAHGFCGRHAAKFKAHGDPLAGRRGSSPGAPLRWIAENAHYDGEECLTWPFEIGGYGYGTVKQGGKKRVASRVMCEVAHGLPDNPTMDAAHSCGNGHLACCNPRHLRWATRLENIADAKRHGTWMDGQRKKSQGLTDEIVREVRRLSGTMLQREIGERFGISALRVHKIINRKVWGWLE